jgi:hypothetical protein
MVTPGPGCWDSAWDSFSHFRWSLFLRAAKSRLEFHWDLDRRKTAPLSRQSGGDYDHDPRRGGPQWAEPWNAQL